MKTKKKKKLKIIKKKFKKQIRKYKRLKTSNIVISSKQVIQISFQISQIKKKPQMLNHLKLKNKILKN